MKKYFLFVLIIAAIIVSCDKVNNPYLPDDGGGGGGPTTKVRKILLEEFTGHTCVNCPRGALAVHSLHALYPEQVIAVSIHAEIFAQPDLPTFPEDFRSSVGEKYLVDFGINGFPSGMVNRRKDAFGTYEISDAAWKDSIDAIKEIAPEAYLTITNTYTSATRQLKSDVKCEFLKPLTGTYNLVLLLTEDSIMAPQKNGSGTSFYPPYASPIAYDFKHMHVLRAAISDANGSGVQVINGSVAAGDSTIKSFTYTLPASFNYGGTSGGATSPVEKNCNVVAFLYNTATQEIVQAEEKEIQ